MNTQTQGTEYEPDEDLKLKLLLLAQKSPIGKIERNLTAIEEERESEY